MADLSERHEVRIQGKGQTIVFVADSTDGRLVIRQESEHHRAKDVCAITLSDRAELPGFFKGLRRILASLGHQVEPDAPPAQPSPPEAPALPERRETDRDTLVAQARQRNPQASAPWTREEEQKVRARHEAGESVESIARAHKRSPRAIELRLQRLAAAARRQSA